VPVFGILSLETHVGHQNNNFFFQRIEKNGSFVQFKVSLNTELAQLLTCIIGQDKGKQKGPLFKHFSTFVVVSHFINGPFEIPEQLAVENS